MTPSLLILLATTTTEAPPPPPKTSTLEVSMLLGPSYVLGPAVPNSIADRRMGMGGALQIVYRTRYFLAPFIDGGYTVLSKGAAHVPAGEPGGPAIISNSLDAVHVAAGLAFDIWRVRLLVGAGVYFFGLSTKLGGTESSTRDGSLGSILGLSAKIYRARRFHLAADFFARNAPESGLNYLTFGLSVHGDALSF